MNDIAKTEVQRINDLHIEATSHAIRAVEAAAECGRALLGVKAKLEHGAWLPWLKTNVDFSDRTARAYMQVAKDPNRQRVANLPLREAIKELSQMSNEKLIEETYRAIRQREIETLRAQQFERMAEASQGNKPLDGSLGTFPVLLADPPWRYNNQASEVRRIENKYPTMTLEDICALPIGDITHHDAVLFLWVTAPMLQEGLAVMKGWGFEYKTQAAWDKEVDGMGHYLRIRHELLFIGVRGDMRPPATNCRPSSVVRAPRRGHSEKPEEVYELIERMYPTLPKIELFARKQRPGWSAWGNEAPPTATPEAQK